MDKWHDYKISDEKKLAVVSSAAALFNLPGGNTTYIKISFRRRNPDAMHFNLTTPRGQAATQRRGVGKGSNSTP